MEVKVATTCMYWSQQLGTSQSPSSSTVSSTSSKKRSGIRRPPQVCRITHKLNLFGTTTTTSSKRQILRTQSFEIPKSRDGTLRRAVSASSAGFSDEEFAKEIEELALKFNILDDNKDSENNSITSKETEPELSDIRDKAGESINFNEESSRFRNKSFSSSRVKSMESPWLGLRPDPPDWSGMNDIVSASIERKAKSVDIPLSLRIIKRKNQLEEGFREVGELGYCSVKKAFSSMVFIIRELHSYTFHMREILCFEDLQGILSRVQKEMNASFVWLFQQIFSHTPTLMMYVMILLANFTVHSMTQNSAFAASQPTESYSAITEMVSVKEIDNQYEQNQQQKNPKFGTSSTGKITSVGGNKGGGGGGNIRSVASSGTEGGDGGFNGFTSFNHHHVVPDEITKVTSLGNPTTSEPEEVELETDNQGMVREDEVKIWNSIVEEASKMQEDVLLDQETKQHFVSPVKVEFKGDDYSEYFRTELLYQQSISQEPTNSLLLSNYAQFLYLVVHDHDRAEEYFKRATSVEPADAEALNRYADFLWRAKKDIEGAEERYLEAIEADPGNMFRASAYAHFLWNTGGEDTCYPLDSVDNEA